MSGITDTERTFTATLDELARLVDESQDGPVVPREVREGARSSAHALADAIGFDEDAATIALVAFAAEMFGAVAVDLAVRPRHASFLIERFEEVAGTGRVALAREVLRWPQLQLLSTDVAIEVQLALLLAFTEVGSVSLWAQWPGGGLKHVSHAGRLEPDAKRARHAATALLRGPKPDSVQLGSELGIRLDRWQREPAALVAHGAPPRADHRLLLLEAAAPALATILERERLLVGGGPSEQAMMTAVERRLARLRFDLHDGPQQDVHLLALDLAMFREQLEPIVAELATGGRIIGRLDDLAAQLVALDGDLRRLSSSVQSPFLPTGTLRDSLRELTDAFATRTGIQPQAELTGDFSKLTDSQQITLLALIREALSNIREHSRARHVTIAVSSRARGVDARVVDDGRGFEPETTLLRAARDGRLGLVGMHERVRMLGGRTQIESRRGGPTVISATLPAWPSQPDSR